MPKIRLDKLLLERGLVDSREIGRRLIMAGEVRVAGQMIFKPATSVLRDVEIELISRPRFVSRGGEKLEAAIQSWQIEISGKVCADIGASTGGFTDCLLQHGAKKVYAIDVGRGILHWKLRNDARIIVLEGTNARHLEELSERVDFVTIDAAFISLQLLLPAAKKWLTTTGEIIALVKPQFEAGRNNVGKGGVVRDENVHAGVLQKIVEFATGITLFPSAVIRSPLRGPAGNVEFLLHIKQRGQGAALETLLAQAELPAAS